MLHHHFTQSFLRYPLHLLCKSLQHYALSSPSLFSNIFHFSSFLFSFISFNFLFFRRSVPPTRTSSPCWINQCLRMWEYRKPGQPQASCDGVLAAWHLMVPQPGSSRHCKSSGSSRQPRPKCWTQNVQPSLAFKHVCKKVSIRCNWNTEEATSQSHPDMSIANNEASESLGNIYSSRDVPLRQCREIQSTKLQNIYMYSTIRLL